MNTQSPSNNAMIYAILALNSEIGFQKDYLENGEIDNAEERADEEEVLDDLEQAFMEFVDLYKARCKTDKKLPSLDDLLTRDW